jgi:RNA 2',3'-cyclic 3'-phosphodiesterase
VRLFAAIDLPGAVRASLAAVVPADERLRFVPPAQWHVTLAFYGEVEEPVVPQLEERLARAAARTTQLRLALAGGGSFPPAPRPARLLWCGIAGDVALLTRLAERAVAAGRRCGVATDIRPFRPHLTLARARGAPVELQRAVELLASYRSDEWTADLLHLVRSNLGPPVTHERVASWALRAP